MKKILVCSLALVIGLGLVASAFAGGATEQKTAAKKHIVFYGKIVEYSSTPDMITKMNQILGNKYDIDYIQVDWANLERVVKTGIASGKPADVYEYWPMLLKPFVDGKMALDLTPYLMADSSAWYNTFIKGLIELGNYGGKYYGVPLNSNFAMVYINKALFDKAGVAVNATWTWDEFMADCQKLKDSGVFPFVNASNPDVQRWLFAVGLQGAGADRGILKDLAAGKIPTSDPIYAKVLNNIKALYDAKYWYPGEGALSVTRDESQAAFYQGKVAVLAEVSSFAKQITDNSKFEIATAIYPTMGKTPVLQGGADGLFIPANAPDPAASVEILKTYLGTEVQSVHASYGFAVANKNAPIKDPLTQSLINLSQYIVIDDFTNLSPKVKDFSDKQIVPDYLLGNKTLAQSLSDLEQLRQEAVK